VFEVVDDKEGLRVPQIIDVPCLSRLGDGGQDKRRIPDRGEGDKKDAVGIRIGEFRRDLQSEPRFAAPASPCNRHETSAAIEKVTQFRELSLASDQRGGRDRQVGSVQAPDGWELSIAQLIDPFRGGQVFEPVKAQISQAGGPNKVTRRLRDQHLSAVTRAGNPCGAMDVDADVAVLG
jgi:hypothetical protein